MGPLTYIAMMIPEQLFPAASSIFSELLRRRRSAKAARQLIAKHLDPVLKATDELQGKLRSLAEEDFSEFRNIPARDIKSADAVNLCGTLYLFAQFWARLEILRREAFHTELS